MYMRTGKETHIKCFNTRLQWNLSIEDTIGIQLAILYRVVSLIQR